MKKIIVLLIGLLFSSVHAAELNEAEIVQASIELAQNPELVAYCYTLYEQGLTSEQIVETVLKHDMVKAYSDGYGNVQMNEDPMPLILGIVSVFLIKALVEFLFSEGFFSESAEEQNPCNDE